MKLSEQQPNNKDGKIDGDKGEEIPSITEATIAIFKISIPQIISQVTMLLTMVMNTAFVGHIGDESEVAGVGVANMLINIICFSLMLGISSALNTFISQAFG